MERKSLFVPFYLEYVGCVFPKPGFEYSIVFRSVNKEYLIVSHKELALYLNCSKSNVLGQEIIDDDSEYCKKSIMSLRNFIIDRHFDGIELDLVDTNLGLGYSLFRGSKLKYLIAILNCIDMSFSSDTIVTNRDIVIKLWSLIKGIDMERLNNQHENAKRSSSGRDFIRLQTTLEVKGEYYSDEIYRNFHGRGGNTNWDSLGKCIEEVWEDETIDTILNSVEKLKEKVDEKLIKSYTYLPIISCLSHISKYLESLKGNNIINK